MASSIIDFEQRKLMQGFTPPASQPDTTSLYDREAHLACGRSRDTAIYIPSDVESDTEDEDDASQIESYATRTSTPDYLDLTTPEHGATESEAAVIGVNTASAVSSTQAEVAPAWPNEPKVSHLADAEPSQHSCQINHLLIGDTSACQDVNFATPPTSSGSQPYPVAADGKQLRPESASQQSNMMVDAISDHDVCHSSQDHRDSPSTGAHSARTASPVEVVQVSLQENEIPAGNSCGDAIPEARTPSPAKFSDEPCQGQALDDTSSASTQVESEATEAVSGSEAEMSSTSPSLRRFHHKSLQMHKTVQSKDGDAGSEGSGSEDGLDGLESQHHEEDSSSLPHVEDSGSEDDDLDDVHQGRKRRKVSNSLSCAVRSTATSSRSPRQIRSATHAAQLSSGIRTSRRDNHSPIPSQVTPAPSEASMLLAQFEEWPLRGVLLKRITEGGKTTFQLQFEWDPHSCQSHAGKSVSHPKKRRRLAKTLRSAAKSSGRRWSPEEDETVRRMKQEGNSWADIQRALPHRSEGTIQVRYSTKIKDKD